MEAKKERFDYLDMVKGFAIIFIVIQHAISNQPNLYDVNNLFLLRLITQFTMPTFFFVNGFLYSRKYSDNPIKGTIRKIKAYYLPFVAYNLFFLIFHNLFVKLHLENEIYGNGYYDLKTYAKHFVYVLMCKRELFSGALWFLGSILIISVVFMFTDWIGLRLFDGKYRYVILTIMVVALAAAGISGVAPEAMKIKRSCTDMAFFYFGFLFRQFDINYKLENKRVPVLIVSAVITVLGAVFFSIGISKAGTDYILYYVLGIIGAMMMLQFCQLKVFQKTKAIKYIGKSSMEIMALQFFVFKLVSFVMVMVYSFDADRLAEYPVIMGVNGAWWVAYSIVAVAIPVLFKYVKDLIKKSVGTIK